MTDNEIIKALECCSTYGGSCKNCPAYVKVDKSNCKKVLKGAVDLINRLQAENENYSHNIKQLTEENLILSQKRANIFEIVNANEKGRTRGIKEFAERLKENKIDIDVSFGYGKEVYTEAVAVIEIDNLVKEMVGENNV